MVFRESLLPLALLLAACVPAQPPESTAPTDIDGIKSEQNRKWKHMLQVRYATSMEVDYIGA